MVQAFLFFQQAIQRSKENCNLSPRRRHPYLMATKVERRTVDLSGFPDLVVVYLGMRVNHLTGLKTLFGFGPVQSVRRSVSVILASAAAIW